MVQNLISATLPAADAAEVQQSLTAAKDKMPFLSTLQKSEVNTLFKPGNAYLPFVDQIYQVFETHPEILPAIFDKEEFIRDYQLFKTLSPIFNQITELMEGVKKTYTAVGSDTLVSSLEVYASIKQNKDKIPGLSAIYEQLSVFFKKTKAKPDTVTK
ncbi:MAG: hypothetical protein P4L34_01235 [Paludibacter sp.]|nr:hypothetical protein [Paludibacter sp.]